MSDRCAAAAAVPCSELGVGKAGDVTGQQQVSREPPGV